MNNEHGPEGANETLKTAPAACLLIGMRLLLCLALLMPLVPGAGATHDQGSCEPQVREAVAIGPLYVDPRSETDVWLYLESNEVAGLQAGGEQVLDLWEDDVFTPNCGHGPDTLLV